jgi:arginine/serine-rich splicing factor 17
MPGQAIPSGEMLDQLRKQVLPEEFVYLRVLKATPEFIRCEAEIENKSAFKNLLSKIDDMIIKMGNSYSDLLKVRAAEAKLVYPCRYEWESFYKEEGGGADVPIEQKSAGERPDTVHVCELPCKWFAEKKLQYAIDVNSIRPSEAVLREVFSIFGEVRLVDIVLTSSGKRNNQQSSSDLSQLGSAAGGVNMPTFEAYIQYKDYISFVKAMDTFRGMKLLFVDDIERTAFTSNIKVFQKKNIFSFLKTFFNALLDLDLIFNLFFFDLFFRCTFFNF